MKMIHLPLLMIWIVPWTSLAYPKGRRRHSIAKKEGNENLHNSVTYAVVRSLPEYLEWSSWSKCSSSCGKGTSTRNRVCPAAKCSGVDNEVKLCFRDQCPKGGDGIALPQEQSNEKQTATWGEWSLCSEKCGPGFRTRKLHCSQEECKNAKELVQIKACIEKECSDVPIKAKEDCLLDQNDFRLRHGSPALEWDEQLASKAADVAQYLAGKEATDKDIAKFESAGTSIALLPYEQNENPNQICSDAARRWYEEEKFYDFKNPRLTEENKHFTQIVWKATKRVGIGKSVSSDGKSVYVVAMYYPPGNRDNYSDFRRNTLLKSLEEEILPEQTNYNDIDYKFDEI